MADTQYSNQPGPSAAAQYPNTLGPAVVECLELVDKFFQTVWKNHSVELRAVCQRMKSLKEGLDHKTVLKDVLNLVKPFAGDSVSPHQDSMAIDSILPHQEPITTHPVTYDAFAHAVDSLSKSIAPALMELQKNKNLRDQSVGMVETATSVGLDLIAHCANVQIARKRCMLMAKEICLTLEYARDHHGFRIQVDNLPEDSPDGSVWDPHSPFAKTLVFKENIATALIMETTIPLNADQVEGPFGVTDGEAAIDRPAQPRLSRVYALLKSLIDHLAGVSVFEIGLGKDVFCHLARFMTDAQHEHLKQWLKSMKLANAQLSEELKAIMTMPMSQRMNVSARIGL